MEITFTEDPKNEIWKKPLIAGQAKKYLREGSQTLRVYEKTFRRYMKKRGLMIQLTRDCRRRLTGEQVG